MIELPVDPERFDATVSGRRRAHVLTRTIGAPAVGDVAHVREIADGLATGRAAFARVTFVEVLEGGTVVVSLDVRMSTDRMPAVRP